MLEELRLLMRANGAVLSAIGLLTLKLLRQAAESEMISVTVQSRIFGHDMIADFKHTALVIEVAVVVPAIETLALLLLLRQELGDRGVAWVDTLRDGVRGGKIGCRGHVGLGLLLIRGRHLGFRALSLNLFGLSGLLGKGLHKL